LAAFQSQFGIVIPAKLSSVQDACRRTVVGQAISRDIDTPLASAALKATI